MSTRDLASVLVKIVGVYFMCLALETLFYAGSSLIGGRVAGREAEQNVAFLVSLIESVPCALLAWVCVYYGDAIAAVVCRTPSQVSLGLVRADLLTVGIALVGVNVAVAQLSTLLSRAGTKVWLSVDDSRHVWRSYLFGWEDLIGPCIGTVIGGVLAVNSRKLANYLEAKFAAAPPAPSPT
jgi:hypothetical protein